MNDDDRVLMPEKLSPEWCQWNAARILLGAEIDLGNGDRVNNHTALADAWESLAASIRGE